MAATKTSTKILLVLVLVAAAIGQWQFDIGHKALSYFQAKPATDTAAAPVQGAAKKGGLPTAVKLGQAQATNLPLIERAFGTAASLQVSIVNARVASQIKNIPVTDGQMVKKGDLLLELDDRPLQATLDKDEATLAKDQAALANAEAQMLRAKTLAARNAGTQADVDTSIAAAKSTEQMIEADKAQIAADQLQIDFTKITAPIDGKLGQLNVAPGNLVTTTIGTGLMTVTQLQPLKVSFRIADRVLGDIRAKLDSGADVTVRVLASETTTVLDTGKITFVDSSVEVASGTIGMATTVANDKLQLWPGQHVDIEVEYGALKDAVTIPGVAIQQGQKGSYVWKVDDQMKVTATPVKVARYEGLNAAISEGLSVGDQFVIEGQAKLNNGATIRTADAKPASDAKAAAPDAGTAATPASADTPPKHKKPVDAAATSGKQP